MNERGLLMKYLIMVHGAKTWYSWGIRINDLSTVKKHLSIAMQRGVKDSDLFVFEAKSPCECIYRIKQLIAGKWVNTPFVDPYNYIWSDDVYCYAEIHIDEYIKYRSSEIENYGYDEAPSIYEWVLRNDSACRDFILWLWLNKKIDKRRNSK